MRIAWFRSATSDSHLFEGTTHLIDEMRAAHDIDVIDESAAHDFVWKQLRQPWDLCVFELDSTPAHDFIHAYALNYPGVAILRSLDLPMRRELLLSSRCVVVEHETLAEGLRTTYPPLHVRCAPPFAPPAEASALNDGGNEHSGPVTFAVFDRRTGRTTVTERAFQRARDAGAAFEVLDSIVASHALARADVVIAPGWPPFGAPSTPVFTAMAAGKTIVTTERDATADWPALDPQTWRPRGTFSNAAPIAITVDPRDEEHSLMLAIRRLSSDAPLRQQLGRAARQWWEAHATPARAGAAWKEILEEAIALSPPTRPDNWPAQLADDGTRLAREILREFGLTSDL